MSYYKPIPCGETLPIGNPHAFSVSMPTVKDVIDFEEGLDSSLEVIKTAYPRLMVHPYINRICEIAGDRSGKKDDIRFLLPSLKFAKEVVSLSDTSPELSRFDKYTIASFDSTLKDDASKFYAFTKHTGYQIFSREAEDTLLSIGENIELCKEDSYQGDSEGVIKDVLTQGYGKGSIVLSDSGMNSIYSGIRAVRESCKKKGREVFILFGWAYSDSISIFKKCVKETIFIPDANNITELKRVLKERGGEIAAVYFETVSNPIIAVPDFKQIYELSREYGFYTLVDNTFATPWNVNISSYCDIIFESLTKFASGFGDLLAGGLIIPESSRLPVSIIKDIEEFTTPLYKRSGDRLALNIKDYKARVIEIGENCKIIESELRAKENIKTVFSINNPSTIANWKKIAVEGGVCPVISFVLKNNFEEFYNCVNLPKGPSLGTEFPILMPYTLLAHYFETKDEEGLKWLQGMGLETTLLRLSIGRGNPTLTLSELSKI